MNQEPLVSIAMPIYNGAGTLVASVRSILQQSYQNWELLLIDDGSDDVSALIAGSFHDERIKVIADGKKMGHGPRLNQAIELGSGKYIARMDQDDISFSNRLEKQVEFLESHPEIDLLATGALVFNDGGDIKGIFPQRLFHEAICRRPWSGFYLPHPTWMGKAEWFRKFRYGGNDVLRAEDQDLLMRSFDSSKFACLPEILFGYRQNSLPMKSVIAGRRSFTKAVVREAVNKRRYWHIPLVVLGNFSKGLAEQMVVRFGLEERLLRHRAIPLKDETILPLWKKLWASVH